ncbi:MAG TPA: hypothetical protein DDY21_00090 [Candidatus Moranbacteria bacterium]|nr:hypothetical protein [Candidatus Moranbacteria bacterium]
MEKIVYAAIKTDDGIFIGKRHCDCFVVMGKFYGKRVFKINEIQGFVASIDMRFFGRREAREIAERAGQLINRQSRGNILYSEDIY